MNSNPVRCRKCLLSEYDGELKRTIEEYIRSIPDEDKVSLEEGKRRLDICKSCSDLNSGTCGQCGCFVEVRTVKLQMHCPTDKW